MTVATEDPGPGLEARRWTDLTVLRPPDGTVWALTAVVGVATDLLARPGVGVGPALLVAIVVAGLVGSGRTPNPAARGMAAAAAAFGACLALRLSPWLLPLDAVAAGGLIVLAASFAGRGDPFDATAPGLAVRGLMATVHGTAGPAFLLARRRPAPDARRAEAAATVPAVTRGLLLAGPVVAVLGWLLASADPLFASLVRFPADIEGLVVHAVLLASGAGAMGGLLRTVSAVPVVDPPTVGPRLGAVEAMTVLGSLVLLYAAFAVTQLVAVLGGAGHVATTTGLTYAEYARSGFFQLLAVAAITLAVLLAVRAATDLSEPSRSRRFTVLAEVAVGLTLGIVAVAVRRLHLYEQAYGLTMLRLFSTAFALWIGAVFVLVAASLAGLHRRRRWLVPAALAVGLAGLLVLNVVDPEAVVIERNLAHYARSGRLDTGYLWSLSDDAVPSLAAALLRLDTGNRRLVLDRICQAGARPDGWSAYNRSASRADRARRAVCPVG